MTVQQLVIRNLSVLEEAPGIAEQIDDKIMLAIGTRVKDWAERQKNWWADYARKKMICKFGPKNWPCDGEQKYMAYYRFGTDSKDDDGCYYYVSALTAAVKSEFGISFEVDAQWMTRLTGKGTKPGDRWQRFLEAQEVRRQTLLSKGFRSIGGSLFLPIRIAKDDLANAYPDALDEALTPVDDALAILKDAHPEIVAIINAATAQFPSPAPAPPRGTSPVVPGPSPPRKAPRR